MSRKKSFAATAGSIAYRYLKRQKKHTLITVISVILAVSFMMVVLTGAAVYNATAFNTAHMTNGRYHAVFSGLTKDELLDIRSMDIFDNTEYYSASVYTNLTDIDFGQDSDPNARMHYLICNGIIVDDWFMRVDPSRMTMLPPKMLEVTEGRLPEKDGEIVINLLYADSWGDPELGGTVTVTNVECGAKTDAGEAVSGVPEEISSRFGIVDVSEHTYTVVGFSENYNIVFYNDTGMRSTTSEKDTLLAHFAPHTNDLYWDMHYAFADKGYEIDDFDWSFNQDLLNAEGKGVDAKYYRSLFMALVYLVLLFIMFCVRMVIDNSFELSSKERVQQFGLLKAAGASSKQIFLIVVMEAVLLSAVGVPLGLLCGYGSSRLIFDAVKHVEALSDISEFYDLSELLAFSCPAYVFVSSAVIGVLWVVVSAVGTGMRVIKASPVDAIRMGAKKEKFKPPVFRADASGKHFTSAYAGLNLKRSKKRYVITLVSLTMSMVMYSAFSYILDIAEGQLQREYEFSRQPYQFTVSLSSLDRNAFDDVVKQLESTGLFDEVQSDSKIAMMVNAENSAIPENNPSYSGYGALLSIHPVNRLTYEKYIAEGSGVSYYDLENSKGMLLCRDAYKDETTREKYEVYSSYVPAEMTGNPYNENTFDILGSVAVPVVGTYSTTNTMYQSVGNNICAVVSEKTYYDMFGSEAFGYMDSNTFVIEAEEGTYIVYRRNIALNAFKGKEQEALAYIKRHFYNGYSDNITGESRSAALIQVMRIIGYFVIGLLSLIAAVNITNIISANVLGRTSEFGMLRACGMSDRQIMSLVRYESMIYAVMATIATAMVVELAVFVVQIPFKYGDSTLTMDDISFEFSYAAPVKYIMISAAAAFIIAWLSSIFPAKRIISTPIVESINNRE